MERKDSGIVKNLLKKLKLNEATLSTLLGALVVIVIGVLIFNYFNKLGEEALPPEEVSEEEVEEMPEEGEAGKEEAKFTPEGLPTKHQVAAGENLWVIAGKYYRSGYNWKDIAVANNLASPDYLIEGQELTIPDVEPIVLAELPANGQEKGGQVLSSETITAQKYVVQKGDNLWEIAVRKYGDGFRYLDIVEENNLANPDLIHAGNEFVLPE